MIDKHHVNSYVTQVCTNGTFGSDNTIVFHGYWFYKGKVGEHNKFSPTSYWTHNGDDKETRVKSTASHKNACIEACKHHSF